MNIRDTFGLDLWDFGDGTVGGLQAAVITALARALRPETELRAEHEHRFSSALAISPTDFARPLAEVLPPHADLGILSGYIPFRARPPALVRFALRASLPVCMAGSFLFCWPVPAFALVAGLLAGLLGTAILAYVGEFLIRSEPCLDGYSVNDLVRQALHYDLPTDPALFATWIVDGKPRSEAVAAAVIALVAAWEERDPESIRTEDRID